MIKQVRRWWKCGNCQAIVDHFRYKYDSSRDGEDESVCPACGQDYGFEEVPEDKWRIVSATLNQAGPVYDIECTRCGHRETVKSHPWPETCYVCGESKT